MGSEVGRLGLRSGKLRPFEESPMAPEEELRLKASKGHIIYIGVIPCITA